MTEDESQIEKFNTECPRVVSVLRTLGSEYAPPDDQRVMALISQESIAAENRSHRLINVMIMLTAMALIALACTLGWMRS